MIGQYVSDPGRCKNYFRCVLGEWQHEQCAPGLHWDARRSICDWPAAAKCQVENGNLFNPIVCIRHREPFQLAKEGSIVIRIFFPSLNSSLLYRRRPG